MDAYLWIHLPTGKRGGHWPIEELERLFDVIEGRDIWYTDGCTERAHLSPSDMAILYQVWDVLLFLSGGEGFGIPAWEAMCSELPIIYSNYSAHAEFIGEAGAGIPVDGVLLPEPHTCVLRMIVNLEEAIRAVRSLYFDKELCRSLGAKGRKFACDRGRLEKTTVEWDSIFTSLCSTSANQ